MPLVYEDQEFSDILAWDNNRIGKAGRLGPNTLYALAEDVYTHLLNALYGWSLRNLNVPGRVEEAVDLIDDINRIVVQVTATCDATKINDTLKSDKVKDYHKSGYRLMFAFVGYQHDAKKVKSENGWAIHDPHSIGFDRQHDALFAEDLESQFRRLEPADRKKVLELVHGDIGVLPREEAAAQAGYSAFYTWECERFYGDTGSELYGKVPLSKCYIEPMVKLGNGEPQSVCEFIESWVDDGTIAVICGEPGHGKTSLCQKAVCDFYKKGWLAEKVPNVFHFSLNPRYTDALGGDSFYFYSLLSWGNDRKSKKRKLDSDDCRGALVFLDGFDELVEWYPQFTLEGFIKECIQFQGETKSHVIVTSRSIVVDPHKDVYTFDHSRTRVPIARLQLLSKDQQVAWIESYVEHCRFTQSDQIDEKLEGLAQYPEKYRKLEQNEKMRSVMGVPIILRMIVAARYLPENDQSIVQIYDGLFSVTWERHKHRIDGSSEEQEGTTAKANLARHALRIFCDNNDTALVDSIEKSPWLFYFYTTNEGGRRVGFLHESFYQYFLAHEILTWFKDCEGKKDTATFRASLSHLAARRIDKTTLQYVRDLYLGLEHKESLDDSFSRAYEVLKETDGIMPLFAGAADSQAVKETSPLERTNNVFWNVVSICSICGHEVTSDRVNTTALRLYGLTECILTNAKLMNSRLMKADLVGAHLKGANLEGADLEGAHLVGADLEGANLEGTDLEGTDLEGTDLEGADLRGARLRRANLKGASLWRARFVRREDLAEAIVDEVSLEGVIFLPAQLTSQSITLFRLL